MIIRIFFGMNLVYACNNAKYWAEKLLQNDKNDTENYR